MGSPPWSREDAGSNRIQSAVHVEPASWPPPGWVSAWLPRTKCSILRGASFTLNGAYTWASTRQGCHPHRMASMGVTRGGLCLPTGEIQNHPWAPYSHLSLQTCLMPSSRQPPNSSIFLELLYSNFQPVEREYLVEFHSVLSIMDVVWLCFQHSSNTSLAELLQVARETLPMAQIAKGVLV